MISRLLDWRHSQSKNVEVRSLSKFESAYRFRQQTPSVACLFAALLLTAGCAVTKPDTSRSNRHSVAKAYRDTFQSAPIVVSDLPSSASKSIIAKSQDATSEEANPSFFPWAPVVVSNLPSAAPQSLRNHTQDGIVSDIDRKSFEWASVQNSQTRSLAPERLAVQSDSDSNSQRTTDSPSPDSEEFAAQSPKHETSPIKPAAFMMGGQDEFALDDHVVEESENTVEYESIVSEAGSRDPSTAIPSLSNQNQAMPMATAGGATPYDAAVGNYVIEVGDQVLLKFFGRPDLNETLIVGADGVISPAIAPPLYAQGKTASMLKAELANQILARGYSSLANRNDNKSVEYYISVDDVIEVRFSILTDLSDTVTVRPDGRISLARIGEVIAEGKTPSELQDELQNLYQDEVRQPELVVIMRKTTSPYVYVDGIAVPAPIKGIGEFTVEVVKSAPRLVYVMGEVSLPNAIPYQPNMTVLRAIGSSGGTKRTANLKHVMILRSNGPCSVREMAVDLRPCRQCTNGINSHTDGGFADIPLLPNDIVLVPQTKIAKVQDWLDQYVYNLFPPLRNSSAFTVLYNNGIPGFNAAP